MRVTARLAPASLTLLAIGMVLLTPNGFPGARVAAAPARSETPTHAATLANADSLPVGLIITHTPDGVRAVPNEEGALPFIWKFATHVRATGSPVRITEFGAYSRVGDRWAFGNFTGAPFTNEDFASWYGCKDGVVDAGTGGTDPNNWQQGVHEVESVHKWVYVGIDASGRAVKGEAVVHCLGSVNVVPLDRTTASATAAQPGPSTSAAKMRPTLRGTVHTAKGDPLAATVFISTAAPKTGISTFCPSCYADCGRRAMADPRGAFRIDSLAPDLKFEVLAVAKGYKPEFVAGVDPEVSMVDVSLEPVESARARADRSLRGRVVDANGAPIEGAVVDLEGVSRGDGRTRWGGNPGVDPCAVTDGTGEFLLTSRDPFQGLCVRVRARGFAVRPFNDLPPGKNIQTLVLAQGAVLTGRIVRNGAPVPGVMVGVMGVNRRAGQYAGHYEIGTGDDGRFLFTNLPASTEYAVYGLMNASQLSGAVGIQTLRCGADGSVTKAGDLAVGAAHRLAGRVVLDDGAQVPGGTRILLGRANAWDTMELTLDPEGRFEASGVPSEVIGLNLYVPGYRLSAKNRSRDGMGMGLMGRVDQDISDLVILMERGNPKPEGALSPADFGSRPLRGAEDVPSTRP